MGWSVGGVCGRMEEAVCVCVNSGVVDNILHFSSNLNLSVCFKCKFQNGFVVLGILGG